jgi:hypothetical protein
LIKVRRVILRWSLTTKEGNRRSWSTQCDHSKAEVKEGLETHEELIKTFTEEELWKKCERAGSKGRR